MRHSIRVKVTFILVLMALCMVATMLLFNSTMLEKYYMADKRTAFIDTYNNVNSCSVNYSAGKINNDEYQEQLEQIASRTNISILIIQSDWTATFASMRNLEDFKNRLQDSLFKQAFAGYDIPKDDYEVVVENDNYTIQQVYNDVMNDTFMELYGTLDNGNMVYMSIAIKSIQDNVRISNRFIWIMGAVLVLVSFIFAFVLSNYISKPVLEISRIAEKMSEFDFNIKYDGSDKSEIGKLGKSMNELSEKLESTISELKEANIELKKDIEGKEEAEERRKEFLSNVSHELKTPIALIQGYAEGLKEGIADDDEESRDYYCDVIIDEAQKMNGMVKNLLNLSHIESGSEQLSIERFDITELISGIVGNKNLLASQKNCEIIYDRTEPQYVWADETKIEEVITNYLTNAINHCEYDKKIIIKNFRVGDDVKVTVFNTGKNIPEEELDKIWIKFYKVDKARTREYGGNGIGLSIVKAIMDLHNKKCGVENKSDGVEFWFVLDGKA